VAVYFSTDSISHSDRYDAWHERIGHSYRTKVGEEDFRACLDMRQVGSINCARIAQNSLEVVRSAKEIGRSNTSDCFLIAQVAGRSDIEQNDNRTCLQVGDVTLIDSTLPCRFGFDGRNVQLCFHLPRELLERREARWRTQLATQLPRRRRRLVGDLMRLAFEESADAHPRIGQALSDAITEIALTAWFEPSEQAADATAHSAGERLQAIQDYLLENLHEDDLTPRRIADAHSISERQLHRLFLSTGYTVCGWIRQNRLDRCAANLRNPALADRNITAIALEHGFKDSAQFSRLFRETFGVAPRAYRSCVLERTA
jgi:AraC family transcriptional regulator, positive regulator of tynA and feaB